MVAISYFIAGTCLMGGLNALKEKQTNLGAFCLVVSAVNLYFAVQG